MPGVPGTDERGVNLMNDHPTFEETYPRYEFAELVRLGIAIGTSILRMLHLAKERRGRPLQHMTG